MSHLSRIAPASSAKLLTANDSDTEDLPVPAIGLYITTAGAIRFIDADGNDSGSAIAFPVGHFPVQVTRIYATGLTAVGFTLH